MKNNIIRKITIGKDYKNDSMHYSVGQEVYGGHTICDVIEEEDLIAATKHKGEYLREKLMQFIPKYPALVDEVRGRGLMLALALKLDPSPIVQQLRDSGLLVVGAGGHAIRFLPPLNVQEEEIDDLENDRMIRLGDKINYTKCAGLSNEVKEILSRHKPQNIAQARVLPGMTPAAASILLRFAKK